MPSLTLDIGYSGPNRHGKARAFGNGYHDLFSPMRAEVSKTIATEAHSDDPIALTPASAITDKSIFAGRNRYLGVCTR